MWQTLVMKYIIHTRQRICYFTMYILKLLLFKFCQSQVESSPSLSRHKEDGRWFSCFIFIANHFENIQKRAVKERHRFFPLRYPQCTLNMHLSKVYWRLWCLTPFSKTFQLYNGSQFYLGRKPQYRVKNPDLSKITDKLNILYIAHLAMNEK